MIKIGADYIFDGLNIHTDKVLVLSDDGKVETLLPKNNVSHGIEEHKGIICPGFINAHCHLELSHLKGMVPPWTGLVNFVLNLQKIRHSENEMIQEAMQRAETEMVKNGIVAVGDISNSAASFPLKKTKNLRYHTFVELFGFNPKQAANLFKLALDLAEQAPQKVSITPHAPYSVSQELFKLIVDLKQPILSIHSQESEEENTFFECVKGDFVELYKKFGIDISFFKASGKNSIKTYLPLLGTAKKLLVHNTFTSKKDIEFATSHSSVYWCFCPNANQYIEKRLPDMDLFLSDPQRILLGTDSLASNHQLCLLEEMKTIQKHFPHIGLDQMLKWATANGADFFNWHDLGYLKKGTQPGINLIEDLNGLQLKESSTIKKLF